MEIEAKFPSGMVARLRGLKGKDYRAMAQQGRANSHSMSQVLQSCVLEVIDPGPYPEGAPIPWDTDSLVGDHIYGLIMVRCATYPDEPYAFDLPCRAGGPRCGKIEWQLDLRELPVKYLSEESRKKIRANDNRFETATSGGQKVIFKIPTERDRRRQRKFLDVGGQSAQLMIANLAQRIVDVDGLKHKDERGILDWLDDLEYGEHRSLLKAFEAVDCGVESDIEVVCGYCGLQQEVTLPLGRTFWNPDPAKSSQQSNERSSSSSTSSSPGSN